MESTDKISLKNVNLFGAGRTADLHRNAFDFRLIAPRSRAEFLTFNSKQAYIFCILVN